MLIEHVARHLRIDPSVIGRIVRQPMRDCNPKRGGEDKECAKDEPLLSREHCNFSLDGTSIAEQIRADKSALERIPISKHSRLRFHGRFSFQLTPTNHGAANGGGD